MVLTAPHPVLWPQPSVSETASDVEEQQLEPQTLSAGQSHVEEDPVTVFPAGGRRRKVADKATAY